MAPVIYSYRYSKSAVRLFSQPPVRDVKRESADQDETGYFSDFRHMLPQTHIPDRSTDGR